MIAFQHPNFAWLFLLLLLLTWSCYTKPIFQSVRVPSIDFWSVKQPHKKNRFKTGKGFHFDHSSLLFLLAATLLILALMTPTSPVSQTVGTNEDRPLVLCDPSLPETVLRVLLQLDGAIVSEDASDVPENTRFISVSPLRPSIYPETGNHLYVSLDNKNDSASVSFQVLASDSNREIAQLIYTSSLAKRTEFPMAIDSAINHFGTSGVSPKTTMRQKKETFSFWLTASAGILFLCRRICSRRHKDR